MNVNDVDVAAVRAEWSKLGRPVRVCLCGSTRFSEAFIAANQRETLAGRIVLSVGMFGHQCGLDMDGSVKMMLDKLHLRKIDASDEILVLDCCRYTCPSCKGWWDTPGLCPADHGLVRPVLVRMPYIGSSTRGEIAHAVRTGKRVRYLSQERGNSDV